MLKYFIVFVFFGLNAPAQEEDTLIASILRIQNDTEQVNKLYKHGLNLVDKNPQLAYFCAQNCERLAKKSNSLKHVSFGDNLFGILFTRQGNYKKALFYFEKYLAANKKLNNGLGLAISCTNLGNVYLRLKDFEKAETYFLSEIAYYNVLNDMAEVANGLINLGVTKHQQKELRAASENYERALKIGKELNNYEIKSICLNNMAQVFFDIGDYEKALAFNFDALELRELMGTEVDKTDSYLSISEIALNQKNIPVAEENLHLAEELSDKLQYLEGKMMFHKFASELYVLKNNYQLAFENLKMHNQLKDSLTFIQNQEPELEFKEAEEPSYNCTKSSIKNLGLLSLLSLFLILIPFVLMRYKR